MTTQVTAPPVPPAGLAISDAELSGVTAGTSPDGTRRTVLFVVNDPGVFWSHRRVFARAAQAAGWVVHVATPAGPDVARITAAGFVHHAIPLSRRGMNPVEDLATTVALVRLLRSLRPLVVDCATIKPVLYGGFASILTRVPVAVHTITGLGHVFAARGVAASLRRGLVRLLYFGAFRHPNVHVLFQNADDRARLAFAVPAARTQLIAGSGVDADRFHASDEPDGVPVVLFAARWLVTKGMREFVDAARQVRAQGVPARFVIVGRPDAHNPASVSPAEVRAWVEAGLVEPWGAREDMPRVIQQAAIVCLPTFYGEGVPKILVEAAASARPIVATDWPGCRDIVRPGENGLLVPPRDARSLAAALVTLLADAALRRRMGARGRALVLERYTEAQVTGVVLRVYDDLVARLAQPQMRPA